MFQPPTPGRTGAPEAPAVGPGKPLAPPAQADEATTGHAPDGTPLNAQGGGSSGGMGTLIMLAPIIILVGMMFLLNRSEKKKRRTLEDKLKKGDRVVTRSGITGKLVELSDRTVRVEIAPGVNVTMVKTAIEGLDQADDNKRDAKDDDSKDSKSASKGTKKKKK